MIFSYDAQGRSCCNSGSGVGRQSRPRQSPCCCHSLHLPCPRHRRRSARSPFAVKYSTNNGASFINYFYALNQQGDVVKIFRPVAVKDADGNVTGYTEKTYATYTYDAWGKLIGITNSAGTSIINKQTTSTSLANLNPLRYRGYYYDNETGFYYLQSRYYDPTMRRFLNADAYASTGQGFIGTNMFAYCNNNPVIFVDNGGTVGEEAAGWWASTMWWLCGIDGFLPIGDIVYGAGLVVCAFVIVDGVEETADNLIERFPSEEKEASDNITSYREHTTTKNGKKRNKHEEGNARRKRDQGGEKKKQKPEWTSRNNKWRIVEEK